MPSLCRRSRSWCVGSASSWARCRRKARPGARRDVQPEEPRPGDGTMCDGGRAQSPGRTTSCWVPRRSRSPPTTLRRGRHAPYSMWAFGRVSALARRPVQVLSLDMRVIDPAWIGNEITQAVELSRAARDFMASLRIEETAELAFDGVVRRALIIHPTQCSHPRRGRLPVAGHGRDRAAAARAARR